MAFAAPVISALSGGLGIVSSVMGMFGKKDKPKAPEAPKAPKVEDATAAAEADVKKRRQKMMQTDLTRGGALMPQGSVQQKSLLG